MLNEEDFGDFADDGLVTLSAFIALSLYRYFTPSPLWSQHSILTELRF